MIHLILANESIILIHFHALTLQITIDFGISCLQVCCHLLIYTSDALLITLCRYYYQLLCYIIISVYAIMISLLLTSSHVQCNCLKPGQHMGLLSERLLMQLIPHNSSQFQLFKMAFMMSYIKYKDYIVNYCYKCFI